MSPCAGGRGPWSFDRPSPFPSTRTLATTSICHLALTLVPSLIGQSQAHAGIQKLLTAEHDATEVVKAAKDGALPGFISTDSCDPWGGGRKAPR